VDTRGVTVAVPVRPDAPKLEEIRAVAFAVFHERTADCPRITSARSALRFAVGVGIGLGTGVGEGVGEGVMDALADEGVEPPQPTRTIPATMPEKNTPKKHENRRKSGRLNAPDSDIF
jgi:hypothetical protein